MRAWLYTALFFGGLIIMVNSTPSYSDGELINGKTETDWIQMVVGFVVLISPMFIAKL
tara:strand:- start:536 stop:709 length:174 start_codon:yes stop_codon:yes gene_type:complete